MQRRAFIAGLTTAPVLAVLAPVLAHAAGDDTPTVVGAKSPACGCCDG